jgi:hypothetical protein
MPAFGKWVRLVAMFGRRSDFGEDLAIDLDLSGFDRPITTLRSAVPAEIKLEKYQ